MDGVIDSLIAACIFAIVGYLSIRIVKKFYKIIFVPDFPIRKDFFPQISHNSKANKLLPKISSSPDKCFFFITAIFDECLNIFKTRNRAVLKKSRRELTNKLREIIYFYKKSISDFKFSIISPLVEDGKIGTTAIDIVDELIEPLLNNNTPEIIFISGKIGSGKSTLISSIVYELVFNSKRNPNNKILLLPIIIDVRETFRRVLTNILEDDKIIPNEIQHILKKRLLELIKESIIANNIQPDNLGQTIDDLFIPLYRRLIRPLIILDELDVVYYEFCKTSLLPSGLCQKDIYKFREIIKFFITYTENEAVGGVYGSVLFIISLRESSLKIFCDSNLIGAQINVQRTHEIVLHLNNSEGIQKIINKRVTSKVEWLEKNPSKFSELIITTKDIAEEFESKKFDYSQNIYLSVHGLRHLMNLFHKVDIFDSSGKLLKDFLTQPNDLLLIYQFLDGSLNYSQTNEGVSNIFLVNKDYKKLINQSQIYNRVDNRYLKEHLQTYFLKYYIIFLIYKKDKCQNCSVTFNEIKKIFCRKLSNEDATVFEKEIVSLILLHATETDHGRLIRLEFTEAGSENDVVCHCTARTSKMFEQNIFWDFKYLMVVIEDNWIGLPLCIRDEFIIHQQWMRTFSFVTDYSSLGSDEIIRFIKYKARLTLIFMTLLDVAHKYEQIRYKTAISNLKRALGDEAVLFQMEKQINELKLNIVKFTTKLLCNSSQVQAIQNYIDTELSQDILNDFHNKIEDFYENYHCGNNINSVATMMKKYHKKRINDGYN
jgi:hypothetical protein